jgi:Fur family transcriptional regulator, peroxide stress response regulator
MFKREEITRAFAEQNLRMTSQRYCIMEYLLRRQVHSTADEVFQAINRSHPRASRATVYNSLNALSRAGLVREISFDGRATLFDSNLRRHHHFVCDQCGVVEDVEWFDAPRASRTSLGSRKIRDFEAVLRGTCENCVKETSRV